MAFGIESKIENGFSKTILRDYNSHTSVEIVPACGAILQGFTVLNNGEFINVIDHYDSGDDFAATVERGFKGCKLSPFACRIKDAVYTFNDQKYTLDKFTLNGSALHGLLYDAVFTLFSQEVTDQYAGIVLLHRYRATTQGYPFNYDCIVTYKLEEENILHIDTEIINRDVLSIPVQDGWHPYFTFGSPIDNLQLKIQSKERILFDQHMIPTGKKETYNQYVAFRQINDVLFDDCFSINVSEGVPASILKDDIQKLQVEIYPDKSYPYLQVYTPPHRNSIAIENLSAIPDAFNNGIGLITLAPGAAKIFSTAYKITLLTDE